QHHSNHPYLHSFPTRRSSDLAFICRGTTTMTMLAMPMVAHLLMSLMMFALPYLTRREILFGVVLPGDFRSRPEGRHAPAVTSRADRKSTRLNSSHLGISYAVF